MELHLQIEAQAVGRGGEVGDKDRAIQVDPDDRGHPRVVHPQARVQRVRHQQKWGAERGRTLHHAGQAGDAHREEARQPPPEETGQEWQWRRGVR